MDAASVAAISALCHFRRPDVGIQGEEVTVVSEITELINKALLNDKTARKAGGRCGFAESMPQERITALKMDQTSVEMTDVSETVSSIVQTAEAPPQTVPSPLVPVPGVGQIGEGLRNTWGLEEEEEEEEEDGESRLVRPE
ncbi:hypothetical protein GOODEAATRI_012493 [Goodea atripinnis]|uniref:Uncharacterized protein n=1 Tax=Goodea atripinnis TaxID=208336 RepID=A0ABV0PDJ7_9TELE